MNESMTFIPTFISSEAQPYRNFSRAELMCRCGCQRMEMDHEFMLKIQRMRAVSEKPFTVTSAFRCPEHNNNVSSTGYDGPHTTGHAIDLQFFGNDAFALLELVFTDSDEWIREFTGIGVSQKGSHGARFIHLDDLPNAPGQPRPWIWSY